MAESSLDPMVESVWLCLFLVHLVLSRTWTLELIRYLMRDCGKGQIRMLSSVEHSLASLSALSFPHSP